MHMMDDEEIISSTKLIVKKVQDEDNIDVSE